MTATRFNTHCHVREDASAQTWRTLARVESLQRSARPRESGGPSHTPARPREGGDPVLHSIRNKWLWIPACAGMSGLECRESFIQAPSFSRRVFEPEVYPVAPSHEMRGGGAPTGAGAERRTGWPASRRTISGELGRRSTGRMTPAGTPLGASTAASCRSRAALSSGHLRPLISRLSAGGTVVSPRRSPGSPECGLRARPRNRPRSIRRTSPEAPLSERRLWGIYSYIVSGNMILPQNVGWVEAAKPISWPD